MISVEVVISTFEHLYDLKAELDVAFDTNLNNGMCCTETVYISPYLSVCVSLCLSVSVSSSPTHYTTSWLVLLLLHFLQDTCSECYARLCTATTPYTIRKVGGTHMTSESSYQSGGHALTRTSLTHSLLIHLLTHSLTHALTY